MRDPRGAERSGLKPATEGQVRGQVLRTAARIETTVGADKCWKLARGSSARIPDCPQVLFLFMGVKLWPNAWSVSSAPVRTVSDPVDADKGGGWRQGGANHSLSPTGTVKNLLYWFAFEFCCLSHVVEPLLESWALTDRCGCGASSKWGAGSVWWGLLLKECGFKKGANPDY